MIFGSIVIAPQLTNGKTALAFCIDEWKIIIG